MGAPSGPGVVGPAGYTMEQLLGTGMPLAEAEIMFNGGTPDTYNGNQISYTDDRNQTAETMPSGPAGITSPSGRRPITGGIMDPITGGSREQPIDTEALWQENPEAFTQLGEGFIGQYIRRPDGSVRSVRDIGDPTGDIGAPAQTGQSGIRYYDSDPNMERMGAFSQALTEQIPIARDYVAGVTGAITGEGYSATQDLLDEAAAEQRMFNPGLRNAGGLTGFGAGMVLTPGAGYIGRGASTVDRLRRAGQVGGGAGFVYGAGTGRGDLQERAVRGGLTAAAGAGGGVAGQRAAEAITPVATRWSQQIADVLSPRAQRGPAQGVQIRDNGNGSASVIDRGVDLGEIRYSSGADNVTIDGISLQVDSPEVAQEALSQFAESVTNRGLSLSSGPTLRGFDADAFRGLGGRGFPVDEAADAVRFLGSGASASGPVFRVSPRPQAAPQAPPQAPARQQRPPAFRGAERRIERVIAGGLRDDRVPLADALQRVDEGALPYELGDNMTAIAEAVRQSPGPGNPIVGQAVTDRVGGVSGRVSDEIAQSVGGANNYFGELNRLRGARQTAAREGMAQFGQTEIPLSPEAVIAIRSDLSTRAVRDEALNAMADVSPEAGAAANRLFGLGDEVLDNPGAARLTVQEAQDISFALREAATRAYRNGFGTRGQRLQSMADAIRGSARDTVPEYAAWLQRYADDSEVIQALELGKGALSGGLDNSAENLAIQLGNMSEEGRAYFQQGLGEELLGRVRTKGPNAVREILRNGEFQDRIRLAFPDKAAYENFIGVMTREADVANRGARIMGGSPTAQRLATQARLEGQSIGPKAAEFVTATGAGAAIGGPAGAIGGGLGMLARELVKGLGQRGRQRANVLSNDETNLLLAEVVTNPDRFRDLVSRAQAREQIPGFSRRASDAIADILQQRAVRPGAEFVGRRAGLLADQGGDRVPSPDQRRAQQ
jgi:hypothetical protein